MKSGAYPYNVLGVRRTPLKIEKRKRFLDEIITNFIYWYWTVNGHHLAGERIDGIRLQDRPEVIVEHVFDST